MRQAEYHKEYICGSSLHGLATITQWHIQAGNLNSALAQLERCIDARKAVRAGFGGGDKTHNRVIVQVTKLHNVISRIKQKVEKGDHNYHTGLKDALVRYVTSSEPHHFEVHIDQGIKQGGSRCMHSTRKRVSTRTQQRKTRRRPSTHH